MPEESHTSVPVAVAVATREAIMASERLNCPVCDYNLTGLTSDRCPECGEPIGVERMRRLSSTEEQVAVPWDERGGIIGYLKTWTLAAFEPRKLATHFPGRHSQRRAITYTLISLTIAAVCFAVPAVLFCGYDISIAVSIVLGSTVTLFVSGNLFAEWTTRVATPTYAPAPYHFWRGLAHYTSGQCIWFGIAGAIAAKGIDEMNNGNDEPAALIIGGAAILTLIALLWWYELLILIVRRRSRPTSSRWLAYLQPPVLLVCALIVGKIVTTITLYPLQIVQEFVGFLAE